MYARSRASRRCESSSSWTTLLVVDDAERGYLYAVRLRGQNLSYRVRLEGWAGEETLASGTIAAGDAQTVRVSGLPTTSLGGNRLLVQARLLAAGSAVEAQAEATWIPVEMGARPS